MSSLHLAVGYAEPGNHAAPQLVYLGRSGAEMQRALAESAAVRFEVFPRIHGIRKHNPRAAANQAHRGSAVASTSAATASLAAESSRLLEENVALKQQLAAAQQELETLRPRRKR